MPYKNYEGKTNGVLIAFNGYVNDLNKLQQFNLSVQKQQTNTYKVFQEEQKIF